MAYIGDEGGPIETAQSMEEPGVYGQVCKVIECPCGSRVFKVAVGDYLTIGQCISCDEVYTFHTG